MVNTYPLRTFATMGLLGDGLVAGSGAEYNAIRFVAGLLGVAGCLMLLRYGDRNQGGASISAIDNQDRQTTRLQRMLDVTHYPVETAFMLGTLKALALIPAGAAGRFVDRLGQTRPVEVASAVTELGALLIGNLVNQIPADTPRPPPILETRNWFPPPATNAAETLANAIGYGIHTEVYPERIGKAVKDFVQRDPMMASSLLFHVGGISYMISGLLAGDPIAASAGLVYTSGNFALGWASKRGQGNLSPE